ncbi:MAG: leucine-rich repeat protein [Rikenellaceae bacterium]
MNRKILALMAAVAVVGAACNDTDQLDDLTSSAQVAETNAPFTLSASVGKDLSTRVAFDDQLGESIDGTMDLAWEAGDSFVVSDGTNSYTFSYTGTDNTFETYDGPLTDQTAYTATLGTYAALATQAASADASHLDEMLTLSCNFTYSASGDNTITFAHDMSILRIKFTPDEDVSSMSFVGGENNVTLTLTGAVASSEYTAYIGVKPMSANTPFTISLKGAEANYKYDGTSSQDYLAGYSYGGTFTGFTSEAISTVDQSGFMLSELIGSEEFNTTDSWVVNDETLDYTSTGFKNLITLINAAGSGVVSLELPNVTDIPASTITGEGFYGCTGLGKLTLNVNGTTIGGNGLRGTAGMTEIVNMDKVTSLGDAALMTCSALTSLDFSGVTELPANLLRDCKRLAVVQGLDNVTTVGKQSFRNVVVTSLEFPALTKLDAGAFDGSESLTELKLTGGDAITLVSNFTDDFDTAACTLTLGAAEAKNVTVVDGVYMWKDAAWASILDTNGVAIDPSVSDQDDADAVLPNTPGGGDM